MNPRLFKIHWKEKKEKKLSSHFLHSWVIAWNCLGFPQWHNRCLNQSKVLCNRSISIKIKQSIKNNKMCHENIHMQMHQILRCTPVLENDTVNRGTRWWLHSLHNLCEWNQGFQPLTMGQIQKCAHEAASRAPISLRLNHIAP